MKTTTGSLTSGNNTISVSNLPASTWSYGTTTADASLTYYNGDVTWISPQPYYIDYTPKYNTYGSTTTITINSTPIDVRSNLKTLDDKIVYIVELAGFKRDEIKLKYFNPDKDSKDSAYIEYVAESENHPLKGEKDKTYKATFKQTLNTKKLNFDTAKVSFVEGLLTVEVEFEEASKVKPLLLPASN